jgi:hypothetical protein
VRSDNGTPRHGPREAQSGRPHPAGSESFTRREGAVLGQNQKCGEYTTLINASAKSPTSVNALAGNGVGHPVPERMVWKPNPLIVGMLQMLSREEMSIQTRLTGQFPRRRRPLLQSPPPYPSAARAARSCSSVGQPAAPIERALFCRPVGWSLLNGLKLPLLCRQGRRSVVFSLRDTLVIVGSADTRLNPVRFAVK